MDYKHLSVKTFVIRRQGSEHLLAVECFVHKTLLINFYRFFNDQLTS